MLVAMLSITMVAAYSQKDEIKAAKKLANAETPDFAGAIKTLENPSIQGSMDVWYAKGEIYSKQFDNEDDKRFQVPPQPMDVSVASEAAYNAYKAWMVCDSLDELASKNDPSKKGKLTYRKKSSEKVLKFKDFINNYGSIQFQAQNYKGAAQTFDDLSRMPKLPMFQGNEKIQANDSTFFYANENAQKAFMQLYKQQVENDTVAAENTLLLGLSRYPNNNFFLIQKIDNDIKHNKKDEAMANIDKAIALNPNIPNWYDVRGAIHSLFPEERAQAEADFNKAIQIDANYYDAYVRLGNLKRDIADDANSVALDLEMKNPREAAKSKQLSNKSYMEAIGYYEKARKIKNEESVLDSERKIYRRLGMKDQENQMKQEIAKLQNVVQ